MNIAWKIVVKGPLCQESKLPTLYNNMPWTSYFLHRRQMEFTTDDIVLSNIRDNGQGGVDFDMYILIGNNAVLRQEVIFDVIQVRSTK